MKDAMKKQDVLEEVKSRIEGSDLMGDGTEVEIATGGIILVNNHKSQEDCVHEVVASVLGTEEVEFSYNHTPQGLNFKLRLKNWQEYGRWLAPQMPVREVAEEDPTEEEIVEDAPVQEEAVAVFSGIMKDAGLEVKNWKNGTSYWNNISQLMWMKKQNYFRCQLIGANPEDYPDFETSKFRGKATPTFDFLSTEIDGVNILRNHVAKMKK